MISHSLQFDRRHLTTIAAARRSARLTAHLTASLQLLPPLPPPSEFTVLKYSVDPETHVAVATLQRPKRGNAINAQLFLEILSVLAHAGRDDAVWCLVWTGEGKVFCGGADFSPENRAAYTSEDPRAAWTTFYRGGVEARLSDSSWVSSLGEAFFGFEKPLICAVNGAAAGVGFSIALCCDLRVGSKEAKFVPAFTSVNVPPESGLSFLLSRTIGLGRAMDVVLTGRAIGADEALAIGLLSRVVAGREELMAAALDLASAVTRFPQGAVRMTKEAVRRGLEATYAQTLQQELNLFRRTVAAPELADMRIGKADSKVDRIKRQATS